MQQDLLSIIVIQAMNMILLAVFIKWIFPDVMKLVRETPTYIRETA